MKTNLWLKSQPNKKIEYPDCFPVVSNLCDPMGIVVYNNSLNDKIEYSGLIGAIKRVEFIP